MHVLASAAFFSNVLRAVEAIPASAGHLLIIIALFTMSSGLVDVIQRG